MAMRNTLAEVAKAPGTAKEIHARLKTAGCVEGTAGELLLLYRQGKLSRVKAPQEKGRPQWQYAIADEAQPQT